MAKDGLAYGRILLDHLFTKAEQKKSLFHKTHSNNSLRPKLDKKRVLLLYGTSQQSELPAAERNCCRTSFLAFWDAVAKTMAQSSPFCHRSTPDKTMQLLVLERREIGLCVNAVPVYTR